MRKKLLYAMILPAIVGLSSCSNSNPKSSASNIDTLAIVKAYNDNHPMYHTATSNSNKGNFMVATPKVFFPATDATVYTKDLDWADSSVKNFRAENEQTHRLMVAENTTLNSYFVSKGEIDSLFDMSKNDKRGLSGIRLYFGKNTRTTAVEGQYTHFIFPTYKVDDQTHNDYVEYGFIEQIKPCPTGQLCPSKDIIETISEYRTRNQRK